MKYALLNNLIVVLFATSLDKATAAVEPSPDENKAAFLKIYRPNHDAVLAKYTNIDIQEEGTGTDVKRIYKKDHIRLHYRSLKDSYRIDRYLEGELNVIDVNTPAFRYRIAPSKDRPNSFVLTNVITNMNHDSYNAVIQHDRIVALKLGFVPYCWLEDDLLTFISFPTTKVTKIEHDGSAGDRRCIVDVTYPLRVGDPTNLKLVFLEDRKWVLESAIGFTGYTVQIEYDDDATGIPLAKSSTTWIVGKSSPENPMWRAVRLSVDEAPKSDSIFRTSQFGFPDLEPPEPKSFWTRAWWYTSAAIAAAVLLVFTGALIRRKRPLTAS
jgi:hypothetical protein